MALSGRNADVPYQIGILIYTPWDLSSLNNFILFLIYFGFLATAKFLTETANYDILKTNVKEQEREREKESKIEKRRAAALIIVVVVIHI